MSMVIYSLKVAHLSWNNY